MKAGKFVMPILIGLTTLALWNFVVEPQLARQLNGTSA